MDLDQYHPLRFKDCFSMDESVYNPTPARSWGKVVGIFMRARYSMPALLRLSQFFHLKSQRSKLPVQAIFRGFSKLARRGNEIVNHFEHASNSRIGQGVVFHHPGVCITEKAIVEPGVHFYRNVTLGMRDGGSPTIRRDAKIASHAVVLGAIEIGRRSIVAAGAVVLSDVPDGKIAAGVPARIIGDVTEQNYEF